MSCACSASANSNGRSNSREVSSTGIIQSNPISRHSSTKKRLFGGPRLQDGAETLGFKLAFCFKGGVLIWKRTNGHAVETIIAVPENKCSKILLMQRRG